MIKRIVLTGGPCAGKTTVLSEIEKHFHDNGYKVFVVHESATELISGGITPHNDGLGMNKFQKLIFRYQYQKEELYNRAVIETREENVVVIYDRGLLDNKAYISDIEFVEILNEFSLELGNVFTEDDILSRYDMVIHLVTSAGNRGYSLANNKARYEDEEQAILLDRRTMSCWLNHGNLHIVDSTENFEDKINVVLGLVDNCLAESSNVNKKIRINN